MPQTAVLGQTDNFKSIGAGSRSFGGTCGEHRNNRTKTLWRIEGLYWLQNEFWTDCSDGRQKRLQTLWNMPKPI